MSDGISSASRNDVLPQRANESTNEDQPRNNARSSSAFGGRSGRAKKSGENAAARAEERFSGSTYLLSLARSRAISARRSRSRSGHEETLNPNRKVEKSQTETRSNKMGRSKMKAPKVYFVKLDDPELNSGGDCVSLESIPWLASLLNQGWVIGAHFVGERQGSPCLALLLTPPLHRKRENALMTGLFICLAGFAAAAWIFMGAT